MVNAIKALLKRWGPPAVKRRIWDREFANGKWDYMDAAIRDKNARDVIFEVLERYSPAADILDLGCGSGSTGLELAEGYRSYRGVDVSEVAIAKAAATPCSPSKKGTNEYVVGDVLTFVPPGSYSIIVFRESLYYCPEKGIAALLNRYSNYLKPGGTFIVRLHDRVKYQKIIQIIESAYHVREQVAAGGGKSIVMVFSPVAEAIEQARR